LNAFNIIGIVLNTFKNPTKGSAMTALVPTYAIYLAISIGLTIWVARTLHKGGRVFLVDVFHGNEELAASVNHLLVVGFYLVNLGYVALALKVQQLVTNTQDAIEVLSVKVGLVLLVLGAMHFANLYVFSRMRRRALDPYAPPPVGPDGLTNPTFQGLGPWSAPAG
jgi:cytochrome c biogenesis protein CcdA